MAETDLSDWLTLKDAAAILRVSPRTVERLGKARKLEQRLRPRQGASPLAVYNPEDVERERLERQPAPAPFVLPAGRTGNGNGTSIGPTRNLDNANPAVADDPIRQLFAAALRAVLAAPTPPTSPTVSERVAETLWVTVQEASAITGLTQALLRRMIDNGSLSAIRDRGWRIRRKDLEQL